MTRCTINVLAHNSAMTPSLSILVIDDNRIRASIIEQGLRDAGHDNVIIVDQMKWLMRQIEEVEPDVIVIDLENPNRDQLEHMFQVTRAVQRPIAMFVDKSEEGSIEAAVDAGVSAYVVDGLKKERVKPILDMAISRFRAYSRLNRELAEAKSELADRKTIDRAKGILMKSKGVSEDEAYQLLRKTAMNQSRKIIEVAQGLVIAAGLLED
jgi:two-component system, response regulator / RNA-binding antiterminator